MAKTAKIMACGSLWHDRKYKPGKIGNIHFMDRRNEWKNEHSHRL